jgi:hypothetical protein
MKIPAFITRYRQRRARRRYERDKERRDGHQDEDAVERLAKTFGVGGMGGGS